MRGEHPILGAPPLSSPYLTTVEASAYLRFKTASAIRTAVMRGELRPCGGGPRGTHLFSVEELDRFVGARGRRRVSLARRRAAPARQTGDRNEEANRNEDEVSRGSAGRTGPIPSARQIDRSAQRDHQGGGQTSHSSECEGGSRPSRRSVARSAEGRAGGEDKGSGLREVLDRVKGRCRF